MENLEILRDAPIFSGLQESDLNAILQHATERIIGRGSFFFMEGQVSRHCYVLVSGRVKLTRLTVDGDQVVLRLIGPGVPFGMVAGLRRTEYPVSIEAITDCNALRWDADKLSEFMYSVPGLALNMLTILTAEVKELQNRYVELSTERVERRIARTLLRLVRFAGRKVSQGVLIDFDLSRQDLAEMSGTTLYTVSRILSRWEMSGIIESERQKIYITYPHGLTMIAEDLPQPDR